MKPVVVFETNKRSKEEKDEPIEEPNILFSLRVQKQSLIADWI